MRGGPQTILIIDDERDIRDFLALLFRSEGWEVELAEDGLAALRVLYTLRDRRELPDLILLDFSMPRMNGSEFRAIQSADPGLCSIPVVLTTGDADGREQAESLGVAGYLQKPTGLKQLLDAVGRYSRMPLRYEPLPGSDAATETAETAMDAGWHGAFLELS